MLVPVAQPIVVGSHISPFRSKLSYLFRIRPSMTNGQPNLQTAIRLSAPGQINAKRLDDPEDPRRDFQTLIDLGAGANGLTDHAEKMLPIPGLRQRISIRKAAKMLKSRSDIGFRNH